MLLYIDPIVKALAGQGAGINIYTIIVRLLLAFFVGAIIGSERSYNHHNAGLRTYILVSLGSTIAMMVNQFIKDGSDISRIGAGVITGIGFLGAGSIIVTSRNQIRGLTTAATLWVTAALGLAIGIGFYTVALICVVLIVITLVCLPFIEKGIDNNSKKMELTIELKTNTDLKKLIDYLRGNGACILQVVCDQNYLKAEMAVYTIHIIASKKYKHFKEDINEMKKFDYINHIEVI